MLNASTGTDSFDGGKGFDTISYSTIATPLTVNLGAGTGTGTGISDTLASVESAVGGAGNDTLIAGQKIGTGGSLFKSRATLNDSISNAVSIDGWFNYATPQDARPTATVKATASGGAEYYTFSTQAVGITLHLVSDISSPHTQEVEIQLFDSTGKLLRTGQYANSGGNRYDFIDATLATPGEYYVEILAKDGSTIPSGTSYLLTAQLSNAFDYRLQGGVGNDTLVGGSGNDLLDGGDGTDLVTYAGLTHAVSADLTTGYADADGIDQLVSIENLTGTTHDDTLTGNDSANVLTGGNGNDALSGGNGDDKLYGGIGTDTLDGGAGDDFINGSTGADILTGGDGNDNLTGGSDADTLSGGDGNDLLDGGAGADMMAGGTGDDSYYVDNAGDKVIEVAGGGNDTVYSPVAFNLSGTNVETLMLTGSANIDANGSGFADTLGSNSGNNVLNGKAGYDTASFATATRAVTASLVTGTATGQGNDTLVSIENLTGSAYADTLTGDGGANVLDGGLGADTLTGGAGNDSYYVNNPGDKVIELAGGGGGDAVHASISYTLGDNLENLYLFGHAGLTGTGNAYDNNMHADATLAGTLNGLSGNDNLYGGARGDILYGGVGNDELYGGGGDDLLSDVTGSNIYDGGAGYDTADFSKLTTAATIDLSQGTVAYGGASNHISNVEHLIGGSGNDTLISGADYGDGRIISKPASILNDSFADAYSLDGAFDVKGQPAGLAPKGTAAVQFHGSSKTGTDYFSFHVETANSTGYFQATDDTPTNSAAPLDVSVYDSSGNIIALGGGGQSVLSCLLVTTGEYFVVVQTNSSYNVKMALQNATDYALEGGAGNDTLVSGSGSDRLDGGAGTDTASFANATASVSASLSAATATGDGTDTLVSIENLTGSSFDDTLAGDTGNNVLNGGGGNNTVTYAASAAGVTASLASGSATGQGIDAFVSIENLTGSNFNDILTGDTGDNVLNGGMGDDVLDGGAGNDTASFSGSIADVTANLATGVVTGQGTDTLVSIENLIGSEGDDVLYGDAGNNIFYGGGGYDSMTGGAGDDTYYVSAAVSVVEASNGGNDIVYSSVGFAVGDQSIETVVLTGDTNGLVAEGGDQADILIGSAGDNILKGEGGDDTLTGGGGTDTFVFDTALGAGNIDTITDFLVGTDMIRLDRTIFSGIAATGTLVSGAFGTGTAATTAAQRIIYDPGTGDLFYDADGNGASQKIHFATLSTNLALTSSSFTVVA